MNVITVKSDHVLPELRKFLKSTSKSWFVYCHLDDIHDNKEYSDFFFFLKRIVHYPKWLLAKLKGFTKRSFTYDTALIHLDKMLAPLISDIVENNHLSNTVVVVTSDHGDHHAYSPKRKNSEKDYFLTMHEELLKIPLLIYNPKPQIKKNYKLIDNMGMTATFLETLNVPFHESFKGISLYSGGRPIVISEHSGRGLPDLLKRGLYFTLTSKNEKLFICIKEKELILKFYNLLTDPIEDNNLIDVEEYRPKILSMLKYFYKERGDVIANRFKKIKCKKFDFEIDDIN
jgi:membrane-anchored protein YejM (alkaline phosphatase superfamily)